MKTSHVSVDSVTWSSGIETQSLNQSWSRSVLCPHSSVELCPSTGHQDPNSGHVPVS